jgi:hypothetical protein
MARTRDTSVTNQTTRDILNFLFKERVFAWRQNTLPIPMVREGVVTGFRPGGLSGQPDIVGILPAIGNRDGGRYIGIEIKTGKDRLRPEQIGFHANVRLMGGVIMVVHTFEDFLEQFNALKNA